MKQKAILLLNNSKAYPNMFATTKEAFIIRVTTILEMSLSSFDIIMFYKKHIKYNGNSFIDLNEEVTSLWAENVVSQALELLNNYD